MNKVLVTFTLLCVAALLPPSTDAQERRDGTRKDVGEMRREAMRSYVSNMLREKRHDGSGVSPVADGAVALKAARASYERTVSDVAASESELHAAVNPIDSNNIVVAPIKFIGQGFVLPIYYSRDFGTTWRQSTFSIDGSSGGDPILAYDNDGNLFFTWIQLGQTSTLELRAEILYAVSADGGETWGATDTLYSSSFTVDPNTGAFSGGFGDKEWVTVDRSDSPYRNTIYAAFVESYSSPDSTFFGIVVRRKTATSATFDRRSVRVTDDGFTDFQFPSVGVDADGRVHVFFWGARGTEEHFLWHAISSDGGEHFDAATQIAPARMPADTRSPGVVPIYLPQRIEAFPQFAVDGDPHSAYSGNLYAVWCSNDLGAGTPGTFDERLDIYFSSSKDGGATWSAPRRMNDDDDLEYRADHFDPSIDVAPGGTVVVSWYDGREAEQNTRTRYYMAVSADGGRTFTANFPVSSSGFDVGRLSSGASGQFGIGDYNKTISTAGYAIPVWSDSRNDDGNLNIYAAFVPLGDVASGVERTVEAVNGVAVRDLSPNPARDRARLLFHLPTAAEVRLDLTDIGGRSVRDFGTQRLSGGDHSWAIDVVGLASGTYLCRVQAGDVVLMRKLVVQR